MSDIRHGGLAQPEKHFSEPVCVPGRLSVT